MSEQSEAKQTDECKIVKTLVLKEVMIWKVKKQLELKQKVVVADSSVVRSILSLNNNQTYYIAGVDISFVKNNNVDACAALVILSYQELKVVYKRLEMIKMTAPYVPGFLAFREVEPILHLYNTMLQNAAQYKPDVILVDGNGQLHPREFGLACHLGVLLDMPCIGVAKTLIHVEGVEDIVTHKERKSHLEKRGSVLELKTDSGRTLGLALRSTDSSKNPIYISVGHNISLESAITIVMQCCKYRIPEPVRLADICSREYLLQKKVDPEEFID
ncbi:LOW QUALITY PROTEIN: endonuclease V-like [Pomacea canaliculata]|uniref:LOW QUALITY PROTEIN: endonuclease V-like n=1 Tax=Pomacea canaliculata TaxID=400727 RepID=UPI000D73F22E|nr:LOW QUALITY PROTEIN: endonuclease V-like [Pomacea canaliculata]